MRRQVPWQTTCTAAAAAQVVAPTLIFPPTPPGKLALKFNEVSTHSTWLDEDLPWGKRALQVILHLVGCLPGLYASRRVDQFPRKSLNLQGNFVFSRAPGSLIQEYEFYTHKCKLNHTATYRNVIGNASLLIINYLCRVYEGLASAVRFPRENTKRKITSHRNHCLQTNLTH